MSAIKSDGVREITVAEEILHSAMEAWEEMGNRSLMACIHNEMMRPDVPLHTLPHGVQAMAEHLMAYALQNGMHGLPNLIGEGYTVKQIGNEFQGVFRGAVVTRICFSGRVVWSEMLEDHRKRQSGGGRSLAT